MDLGSKEAGGEYVGGRSRVLEGTCWTEGRTERGLLKVGGRRGTVGWKNRTVQIR